LHTEATDEIRPLVCVDAGNPHSVTLAHLEPSKH
jgi:hypothetical protein